MNHEYQLTTAIRQMVMRAEMIAGGFPNPKATAESIVNVGRQALADIGQPMAPKPHKAALPVGIDPRTGHPAASLGDIPGAAEMAALESIHAMPEDPVATIKFRAAIGLATPHVPAPDPKPASTKKDDDLWA